jgi:hypothetical protein
VFTLAHASLILSVDAIRAVGDSGRSDQLPDTKLPAEAAQNRGHEVVDKEKRAKENLETEIAERVAKLAKRDAAVHQHEEAHKAAAGSLALGAPSYAYVTGPDGVRYAVSGEVRLDSAVVPGDPDGTVRKLEQVRRAALAPADPSSQDQRVASQADHEIARARATRAVDANARPHNVELQYDGPAQASPGIQCDTLA